MLSLIGNVVERSPAGPPTPPSAPGPVAPSPLAERAKATGFPASVHMGFPRKAVVVNVPSVGERAEESETGAAVGGGEGGMEGGDVGSMRGAISRENEGVLANMTEEDILEEQRQIRESLGLSPAILAMLQARANKKEPTPVASTPAPHVPTNAPPVSGPPLPKMRPAPAGSTTAPTPKQPHKSTAAYDDGDDEGSPEYIRRHFFPNEPRNAALDWMRNDPKLSTLADPSETSPSTSTLAFDLSGALSSTPAAPAAATAASAGGSHHASADGTFTIPGLLSLTASSVPSQRSTALVVLARMLSYRPSHAETMGAEDYEQVRVTAAGRAVYALRDPNQGVAAAAIGLLLAVLEPERGLPAPPAPPVSGAEPPPTVISTVLAGLPLTALAGHLTLATLPPNTLSQVLAILTLLLSLPPALTTDRSDGVTLAAQIVNTPGLVEAISDRFVAVAWPPVEAHRSPVPQGLEFLTALARTSRSAAKAVVDHKLHEHPLRFLAMPPWELEEPRLRGSGYELLGLALQLWETLGRYGMGARLWTQATGLFGTLGNRLQEGKTKEDEHLTTSWLNLLATWATVAVDPHVSEHDILWSQVQGWEEVALTALEWANAQPGGCGAHAPLAAAAWDLFANWLEGSKVNRAWRGEEERKWIHDYLGAEFSYGGRADVALRHAIKKQGEEQARMVLAAIRLSDAYEEDSTPKTGPLLEWKVGTLETVFGRRPPSWASVGIRVRLLRRLGELEARVRAAVELLPMLRAGDEVAARDIVDWLTGQLANAEAVGNIGPLAELDPLEVESLAQVHLLRPFLTHAIVTASGGRVTGPLHPTPKDIKLTASLPPLTSGSAAAIPRQLLSPSWPLAALDELLRSGSSVVLQRLPSTWEGSELEVVRASVALTRVTGLVAQQAGPAAVAPADLVYQLIKVFMLEKDHPAPAPGAPATDKDLFRHPAIQHSINKLLDFISVGASPASPATSTPPPSAPRQPPLELAHAAASSSPLFQLFSDLAGLFAAISLGDRAFARVLLPFLRTAYAVDYRRLLWVDYADALRSITTPASEAVSDAGGGLEGWVGVQEEDEVVLLGYADAVVKGRVTRERNGFLYGVAVGQVSGALFGEDEGVGEARRRRLAGALVQPGRGEAVSELVGYGGIVGGGREFGFGAVDEGERRRRVETLEGLLGDGAKGRLEAVGL